MQPCMAGHVVQPWQKTHRDAFSKCAVYQIKRKLLHKHVGHILHLKMLYSEYGLIQNIQTEYSVQMTLSYLEYYHILNDGILVCM